MTIQLISNGIIDIPANVKRTLSLGIYYKVLSIYVKRDANLENFEILVRVLSDDGVPALYNIAMFEIVDASIETDFVSKKIDVVDFVLCPESISYSSFWDDFFNDDEHARIMFVKRFPELGDKLF